MMDGSALDLVTAMGMMDRNNRGYDGDGFGFGGSGIWLIVVLFFFVFMGGNGFGGWGGNNAAVNQMTNEFLFTNLNNTMERGFDQLTNQNFGLQKDLCQGFSGIQLSIAESRYAADKCCCETKEQIMTNRYENAKNTCDVITAVNAGTQRVIDQMQNDKIDELRTSLNTATIGNLIQQAVQSIVGQVSPRAVPSWSVCNPGNSTNDNLIETLLLANLTRGNLFGNGCGCNNSCNGWNGYNYNFG